MTKSETGLIASMFYVFYAPFQIVGGIAVDRHSPYKLILIGLLGAGIANILIYLLEGYVAMLIIWSLNGMIQFGVWPGIFKIVTTELMPEHRTNGILYIHMSYTVGLVLSYLSAALISDWKNNFLFSALTLFILSAIFLVIYKLLSRYMKKDESAFASQNAEDEKAPMNDIAMREKILAMLKAGIPLVLIISLIHSLLNLGIKALAPVMLMESYEEINASLANVLNILLVLSGPIGLFASHTAYFNRITPTKALSVLLALTLPLLAVVCFIGIIPSLFTIAAMCLVMVITGAISILFSNIARDFTKYNCVGTLIGTINCMSAVGILIANYAFSKIAEEMGWQFTAVCWLILSALAFLLALASIPLWSRFKRNNSV